MWVERIALTFTSREDHTTWGSFLGSKLMILIKSAGPPAAARRSFTSERRWAISPEWINGSAICNANFLQLIVKPSGDATSELHTTSIFGAVGLKCHRS